MFKFLWAFFIMISPVMIDASVRFSVSNERIANAQTMLFKINTNQVSAKITKAYVAYLGRRYPFFHAPGKSREDYYALVPTKYYQKPKKTNAVIVYIDKKSKHYISVPIMIEKGKYKSEKLHVKPSRAKISKKSRIRIQKEAREARKIYNTFTQKLYFTAPFVRPLESKITSAFGTKRVFNGILKSYHSGTDFRAKTGTEITAANRGRVVLVKKRFFAGNSVIIDHGEGIYTGYYHLTAFKVHVGDMVEQGEVIGLAGATGRVTGPHLHFAVHVSGTGVDPMQFLETVNQLF